MIIPVSSAAAGDLVACHSHGVIGSAIRLGQRLQGDTWQARGLKVPAAAADEPWMWNHFAILDRQYAGGTWSVIQAEAHGVTGTDNAGKAFDEKPLSAIAPGGRFEILQLPAGAERCRVLSMARGEVGAHYGFVSIASIVATLLTPRPLRFDFRRGGTWICSALAGEALRAGGWFHQWSDIYQLTPAQLYAELLK
jgi:hypothetical protein